MGGRAGTCVYTHTPRHLCRQRKWPLGLHCGGSRPRSRTTKPSEPSCPALSPWARSWLSVSGPSLFKGPLGTGLPLGPSLGVLSTCLPALRRGWSPPPLPPRTFPNPELPEAGSLDPASCCPVWGPHTRPTEMGARDLVCQTPWAMLPSAASSLDMTLLEQLDPISSGKARALVLLPFTLEHVASTRDHHISPGQRERLPAQARPWGLCQAARGSAVCP